MVYVQDHLGTHPQESSSDCRELVMLNPMTLLADPTLGLGWVVKVLAISHGQVVEVFSEVMLVEQRPE